MIFINFKSYEESTGERGLKLLNEIAEVSQTTSVQLIPVVSVIDLAYFSGKTTLPLWVQHIDDVTYGAHTGSVLPEEVKALGAVGTFLNHSEHRLDVLNKSLKIKDYVDRAKEVNLKTLVFAGELDELKEVLNAKPDYASYEPPELVGSTTVSVATAKPEVIEEAAALCQKLDVPLIVGAGIHSEEDIRVSLKLGASGFAVATNIVKASSPKEALLKLLSGFS